MKSFFSRVGKFFSIVKQLMVALVVLLIVAEVVALIVLARPRIPESGVLLIEPQGDLVEQIREPGADALPFALPDPDQTRVRDVVKAIAAAAQDPRILAIELNLESMGHASLSQLQRIHESLMAFRATGKPVLAAQYNYTQAQYYFAAAADEVWLHPMGAISLSGIGVYQNYFRDALDKLNITIHLFRAGKYKSAAEPLIRNSMSDAAREANLSWMTEIWNLMASGLSEMRGVDPDRLQILLDHPADALAAHQGDLAALLLQEKLIDKIGDPRQAEDALAQALGMTSRQDMEYIPLKHYLRVLPAEPVEGQNRVAIVTASGTIVAGQQPGGVVGGDTLADLLDDAANDATVKAVVLRIDSPGGSAQASEVIRSAVSRVQAAGKPVVVSMASLAASGGYWIAAGADEIWAHPSTLTGSIGVFGVIPNFSNSLEYVGVHTDGLGTSRSAEGIRVDRPLSEDMERSVQMGVDHIYRQFLHVVAQGRHMTEAQVDELAQGRVWSGADGLRLGLVDQLGGLDLAVASAAKRAGLDDHYTVFDLTPPKAWPAMIAESILGESKVLQSWSVLSHLPLPAAWLQQAKPFLMLLQEPNKVYAYSDLADQGGL